MFQDPPVHDLVLENFLGYGREFLPARGLIARNAHIGKPRVSRGSLRPTVAFGFPFGKCRAAAFSVRYIKPRPVLKSDHPCSPRSSRRSPSGNRGLNAKSSLREQLCVRPDAMHALARGWIEPTPVSRRSEVTSSGLRCYENRTVWKVGSLDVSILAIAGARPVPILEAVASRCVALALDASGSRSGSYADPNSDRDNCQRYDDHQHVDRQPRGDAFCRLGHSVCPLRTKLSVRWPKMAMNEFTCLCGPSPKGVSRMGDVDADAQSLNHIGLNFRWSPVDGLP